MDREKETPGTRAFRSNDEINSEKCVCMYVRQFYRFNNK